MPSSSSELFLCFTKRLGESGELCIGMGEFECGAVRALGIFRQFDEEQGGLIGGVARTARVRQARHATRSSEPL